MASARASSNCQVQAPECFTYVRTLSSPNDTRTIVYSWHMTTPCFSPSQKPYSCNPLIQTPPRNMVQPVSMSQNQHCATTSARLPIRQPPLRHACLSYRNQLPETVKRNKQQTFQTRQLLEGRPAYKLQFHKSKKHPSLYTGRYTGKAHAHRLTTVLYNCQPTCQLPASKASQT